MAGKYEYLTHEDRRRIAAAVANKERPADIAARIGVHTSTLYRELQRGRAVDDKGNPLYDPAKAQQVVDANVKRRGRRCRKGIMKGGFHDGN